MKCNNCEKKHFSKLSFILLSVAAIGFWSCKPEVTPEPVVKELSSIEITKMPEKLVYWIDQIAEFDDMEVTATYTTGEKTVVTGWTYNGFDTTTETTKQTITVSYTEGEITKTTAFDISVEDVMVVGLEIATEPTKKKYYLGDEIDLTGLKLNASYDNGQSLRVKSGYTVAFEDPDNPGSEVNAVISYMGKTVTYKVELLYKYKVTYTTERLTPPTTIEGEASEWRIFTKEELPQLEDGDFYVKSWLDGEGNPVKSGDKITGNMALSANWVESTVINVNFNNNTELQNFLYPYHLVNNDEVKNARILNIIIENTSDNIRPKDITTYINWNIPGCLEDKIINLTFKTKEYFNNSDNTFKDCKGFDSIVFLPGSIQETVDSSFEGCTSLKKVVLPEGITKLAYKTFYKCTSLETVELPEGLQKINSYVFGGCTSLKSIVIPNTVTEIAGNAFYNCTSLETVELPEGLTIICGFYGCTSLKSIVIPNTVTEIGKEAFRECKSLKSIVIPNTVTEIGENAFGWSWSLESITFMDPTGWKKVSDGTPVDFSNPEANAANLSQLRGESYVKETN